MNNLDQNSNNLNYNNVVLEQILEAEKLGEVHKPLRPSLMKIMPEARPQYRSIIIGTLLFMLALHGLGLVMVPQYSSFMSMHLTSIGTAFGAILVLGFVSYRTSKLKNL